MLKDHFVYHSLELFSVVLLIVAIDYENTALTQFLEIWHYEIIW